MFSTMRLLWEVVVMMLLALFSKAIGTRPYSRTSDPFDSTGYCLSWRVAVEANNLRAWRTVPFQCLRYVENYMVSGQYERDLGMVIEQIYSYIDDIVLFNDGMDAWILDVDDTCISNLWYYKGKRFGCDPYDPIGFKFWALRGVSPAIPAVLDLFTKLVENGFKVFLVTGRDEETLGQATLENLHNQGYLGYERLILRYVR
uniref:Acid phosphatase 1-like n=1 Tax=Nelumbo nucifera TaxID=4432 RepID=A0A822XVR7_NELNU|nr:TPA_asm: hypothetical protein HUJ06_027201 [Nelumbo nucifera]